VEELGDRAAATLGQRHDRIARDLLAAHEGREIDKTDGFLLLFERPFDAVGYALAYHTALRYLADEEGRRIEARVGIHLGEVLLYENSPDDVGLGAKALEVEGLAKPMTARLMSLAQGGQTLLTRGAFDLARRGAVGDPDGEELSWLAHGGYLLQGVAEPIEVFEVGREGTAPLVAPEDSEKVRRVVEPTKIPSWRPTRRVLAFAMASLLVVAVGGLLSVRHVRRQDALAKIPLVVEKAQAEDFFAAYDLALEIRRHLPKEPTIAHLAPVISMPVTVTSEPPGATVYLQRFVPDEVAPLELIGTTPLQERTVARGDYILRIEKNGYASWERTVSGAIGRAGDNFVPLGSIHVAVTLDPADDVPTGMVRIPGGLYQLGSRDRPSDEIVVLDEYLIDLYEVSNRKYQEFVQAGGYRDPRHWRLPFVRDGEVLSFEEAMRELRDQTGLPGPRGWSGQSFPEGKGEHPVTGVTAYEAAAYADFRGQELPTLYQWEKAARDGLDHLQVTPWIILPWGPIWNGLRGRANFSGRGTLEVATLPFGMSPYGCRHMAGNVAEWCRAGTRGSVYAGGTWRDLLYLFSGIGYVPNFYAADTLGFRCVRNLPGAQGDQGAELSTLRTEPIQITAIDKERFEVLRGYYDYDATPLDVRIMEVIETPDFRRQKISYQGAGGKQALAYLYLPTSFKPPYQVIQYIPASPVFQGAWPLRKNVETLLTIHVKTGRAVFAVVLEGFLERPWPAPYEPPPLDSVRYREELVSYIVDQRRGLDVLADRDDIDSSRIAFYGMSAGAHIGMIAAAVEPRYRTVVFVGAGLNGNWDAILPEANPTHFVPYVTGSKLLLSGRYDEILPYETRILPLYELLAEPKRLITFDGGHTPTFQQMVQELTAWLDESLGPV
jgi:formylglycine-generating enzyme required for sulfatase activity/class 3 adenylate cyclase/dienelactone hydrolase